MFAANSGYTEIVQLLVKRDDIDVNIKDIWLQKFSLYSNFIFF